MITNAGQPPRPEEQSLRPVHVTDAPGYDDFDGHVLLESTTQWPMIAVGYDIDGKRDIAVVPMECVTDREETTS